MYTKGSEVKNPFRNSTCQIFGNSRHPSYNFKFLYFDTHFSEKSSYRILTPPPNRLSLPTLPTGNPGSTTDGILANQCPCK